VALRTPLNAVDQLIFHLDQAREPWTVHCEVRVPGRLDPSRLGAAAVSAAQRHPLARARLGRFRPWDRVLHWEIADRLERVPLTVAECEGETAVADVRARLLSQRVALEHPPPFALALARRPDGDSLILNLNHVAADGISSVRLMSSIARAYAGAEDPVPDLDPLAVRGLREHLAPRDRSARTRNVEPGRPARIARADPSVTGGGGAGGGGAPAFGFHLIALDEARTAALLARRRPPATINDLLMASLVLAIRRFGDLRGVEPARISVATPVNLRSPERPLEVVSNLFTSEAVSIPAGAQLDLQAAERAVAERTRALKQRREAGGMIPAGSGRWPVGVLHLATRMLGGLASARADTVVLSNLGTLPAPDFGPGGGQATELWFSPPGPMPSGVSVGVATISGRMHLTIRYCAALFDRDGAAAFADCWREVMLA
jgi:NRPS condensation-like uncharacterized protein